VQYLGPIAQDGIQFVTGSEWIGDTGTCEGDSGSPALDVVGQSFGVLSRGPAGACDSPIYTSVHAYADWIRSAATAAASAAGIAAPAWVTPPANNSAHLGDPCTADTQCDEADDPQLACLVVGNQRRCSYSDCSLCATGWVCGSDPSGASVCVPDPNAPPPDAGTPGNDAATTTTDAGTGGDAGASTDGGTGGSMHGGCSAAPTTDARGGAFALAGAGLALALGARRRRSRAAK
jgi:uncharacterized protein (TIGR03382 family)